MGQIKHPASTFRSKKDRKEAAAVIAEERAARTPQQQLKLLDTRLGKEEGAKKERARLRSAIKAEAERAKAEKAEKPKPKAKAKPDKKS